MERGVYSLLFLFLRGPPLYFISSGVVWGREERRERERGGCGERFSPLPSQIFFLSKFSLLRSPRVYDSSLFILSFLFRRARFFPARPSPCMRFAFAPRRLPLTPHHRRPSLTFSSQNRCGYTGEDGFELAIPSSHAVSIASLLLSDPIVNPAGLGARDSLRLEAGLCLYGNDIDDTTTPVEAALGWTMGGPGSRRRKGGGFPGSEIMLTPEGKFRKVARKRVGIKGMKAPARGGPRYTSRERRTGRRRGGWGRIERDKKGTRE